MRSCDEVVCADGVVTLVLPASCGFIFVGHSYTSRTDDRTGPSMERVTERVKVENSDGRSAGSSTGNESRTAKERKVRGGRYRRFPSRRKRGLMTIRVSRVSQMKELKASSVSGDVRRL